MLLLLSQHIVISQFCTQTYWMMKNIFSNNVTILMMYLLYSWTMHLDTCTSNDPDIRNSWRDQERGLWNFFHFIFFILERTIHASWPPYAYSGNCIKLQFITNSGNLLIFISSTGWGHVSYCVTSGSSGFTHN